MYMYIHAQIFKNKHCTCYKLFHIFSMKFKNIQLNAILKGKAIDS